MSMKYKAPREERIRDIKLKGSLEITIKGIDELEKAKELLYQAQKEYGLPNDVVECVERNLKPSIFVVREEPRTQPWIQPYTVSSFSVKKIPKRIIITTTPEEYREPLPKTGDIMSSLRELFERLSWAEPLEGSHLFVKIEYQEIERALLGVEPYQPPYGPPYRARGTLRELGKRKSSY